MTDSPQPVTVYSTEITPPGQDGYVEIAATQGSQAFSAITGTPLNDTDPGKITFAVGDDTSRVVAKVELSYDIARLVYKALDAALSAADTRDHSLDRQSTT